MAELRTSERQHPLTIVVPFTYLDLATGVAQKAVDLPDGATVVSGAIIIDTAWNTGTTDVVDVGDATTGNRYAAAVNLKTAARTALTITGFVTTNSEKQVLMKNTAVGTAATAGAGRLIVEYLPSATRGMDTQPRRT